MSITFDPVEVRKILGVEFCQTCAQDTLPLPSGCCAWCDTQLIPPVGKRRHFVAPTEGDDPPPEQPGFCAYCQESLPAQLRPQRARRFCSDSCKQKWWCRYTPKGRAWIRRHTPSTTPIRVKAVHVHGTESGYNYHRCRCTACRAAAASARRLRRWKQQAGLTA